MIALYAPCFDHDAVRPKINFPNHHFVILVPLL